MNLLRITALLLIALTMHVSIDAADEPTATPTATDEAQPQASDDESKGHGVPPEQLEYAKGSVCRYCEYCQFCKLCDEDCPCETSLTKPNCKMCKYCKYCYLCSAVCDTICTPGGILDRVSGAIVNALPTVNLKKVDSDIDSVKPWINKKKDEL